ncbi:MAG: CHRD domain-containing protein [Candidatus Tectomicrobia bacterium]|nr:CHRD domain-containing protein [Candidatus Tectomicrobia bacterium]
MLQTRVAVALGALVLFCFAAVLPPLVPAAEGQAAASLSIVPSEVRSTDPVDIRITATFPLGLQFVTEPRISFNGRDVSREVIPLLGENLVNLNPAPPAVPTSLTIALDDVRFPPGLQGAFELSFKEGTRTVRTTFTAAIPLPVGMARLTPTAAPGASGEAFVSILTNGDELEVTLSVAGLPPGTTHANAFHRGFCPSSDPGAVDRQGPPVVTLNDLSVGADGAGSATTRVARTDASRVDQSLASFVELLSGSYYLNVRSDPRLSSASQLCGPLRSPVVEVEADAILEPAAAEARFGTATFIIARDGEEPGPIGLTLIGNVAVGGMGAAGVLASHLHSGACPSPEAPQSLGPAIAGLNDVHLDDAGAGRQLTILALGQFASLVEAGGVVAALRAGPFAAAVHAGPAASDPVALCGSLVTR